MVLGVFTILTRIGLRMATNEWALETSKSEPFYHIRYLFTCIYSIVNYAELLNMLAIIQ
jgi:hypothetical protein